MVLEPLGAFALACNVIQLLDSGAKVLSKAAEYRTSSDGALSEQKDLRTILESLGRLNNDLRSSLSTAQRSQTLTVAEKRLMEANQECLNISRDFTELLDSLRVANPHALFETIRKSVKSIRYREKIDAMDNKLTKARDNLNLSFLIYMNSKQNDSVTRSDLLDQNSRLEANILQALTSSSTLIRDQVEDLAQRLEGMNLASVQRAYSDFSREHHQFLYHLSRQLDSICAMHNAVDSRAEDLKHQQAHSRLTASLHFPQLRDRRDRIHMAYHDTYGWVLDGVSPVDTKWDNFVGWLKDLEPRSRIYWISSKPGAGKSSLIRFLDEQLLPNQNLKPWAEVVHVHKAQYYFWKPGENLQKTLAGLLRTILYQIFDELPELLFHCVPTSKWKMAQMPSGPNVAWTDYELRHCLKQAISSLASSANILLLIDGLDEIEGDEDAREELVELLRELAGSSNVKMCVSSRNWPIFQDAFAICPQMRLEDLNRQDIENFVKGQFLSENRYRRMLEHDIASAESLLKAVIAKAGGVFLWVRLVVKELLRGIRDGDSYRILHRKLETIPSDLNHYFDRLMESIEPHHQKEACALLQLALHDEPGFTTLHDLRLMDLIFMDDANIDFALNINDDPYIHGGGSAETLYYRLESALRRLSSRCKGLLECYYHFDSITNDQEIPDEALYVATEWLPEMLGETDLSARSITALPRTLIPILAQHMQIAFKFEIDFMHRSVRDYLLESMSRYFPDQRNGFSFDAGNYLRNARLMHIFMHKSTGVIPTTAVGLASYFICTLSLPHFRNNPRGVLLMTKFRTAFDYVKSGYRRDADYWYICRSLESWAEEQSNFLTLAIDFGLTGYVNLNLSPDVVNQKGGRPLLDYVLRPRFATVFDCETSIGNQYTDPTLVRSLISSGADPNQMYNGVPLWPLFLSFVAATGWKWCGDQMTTTAYFVSLKAMITGGAALCVASSSLSAPADHGLPHHSYDFDEGFREQSTGTFSFLSRWPGVALQQPTELPQDIDIQDILECLRAFFGDQIDSIKSLARQRTGLTANAHVQQRFGPTTVDVGQWGTFFS